MTLNENDAEKSPDFVQSLARGLEVIRCFDREYPSMSLTEVAERTGLAKAVVRRFLMTLEQLGYVGRTGRNFYLTPRVLELGYAYLSGLDISEAAMPLMRQLSEKLGQSVSVSVLDGDEIVYVLRVPVRRIMTVALGVGARLPAWYSSMGRVLLADLTKDELQQRFASFQPQQFTSHTSAPDLLPELISQVKEQGYAIVEQELEPGLGSVAVPIHNDKGKVVAALNIGTAWQHDFARIACEHYIPELLKTARDIERVTRHQRWGFGL